MTLEKAILQELSTGATVSNKDEWSHITIPSGLQSLAHPSLHLAITLRLLQHHGKLSTVSRLRIVAKSNERIDVTAISQLTELTHLHIERGVLFGNSEDFQLCPHLSHLHLENVRGVSELSVLPSSLEHLTIILDKPEPVTHSLLSSLPKLAHLHLTKVHLDNSLSLLSTNPNLQHLCLEHCLGIEDLSVLTNCKKLRYLSLMLSTSPTNINALFSMKQLHRLQMHAPHDFSISPKELSAFDVLTIPKQLDLQKK